MRGPAHATAVLAGIAAVAACDPGEDRWQGTVRSADGVEVVSNTGRGVWTPESAWSVREDLRLSLRDVAAASDEDQPFRLGGLDVDSEGRVHVLLPTLGTVRVYSHEGELVHSYGEPGTEDGQIGPMAGPLLVLPGDTVVVPEVNAGRFSRFTKDGRFVDGRRLALRAEGVPIAWRTTPDGQLVQQAGVIPPLNRMHEPPANLLLRRTGQGEIVDTIAELPSLGVAARFGLDDTLRAIPPEPMWTVTEDGRVVTGVSSDYRLRVLEPDGRTARVIERRVRPVRWTERDREALRRSVADVWVGTGLPEELATGRASMFHFTEHYPVFADLLAGPDGSIWVRSVETVSSILDRGERVDLTGVGGRDWDIFGEDGRYLGTVSTPREFFPVVSRDGMIYGVLTEDGTPRYVIRYTVVRGEAD